MNTSDIMALINDLEERFAVDQWTVGGIRIWPVLRIKLSFELFNAYHINSNSSKTGVPSFINSKIKNFLRFGYAYLVDYRENIRPNHHAKVVLVSDGVSFTCQNKLWYEKFCDPLIDRLETQGISTFLLSLGHSYLTPRRSPSMFIQTKLDFARIKSMLSPAEAPANESLQRDYARYSDYLENMNLDIAVPTLSAVKRYRSILTSMAEVYQRLFHKIKPSLVFIVSYYSMEGMAVNLACRRLNIPVIDLQHGMQGELHVAYARWKRVPLNGYELLPSHFWVWGEDDAGVIKQWSENVSQWHRPIVGGNLWLNEWRFGHSKFITEHDTLLRKVISFFPGKQNILVTLQHNLADEKTLGALLAAMKSTQHMWRWWVRLHPCMLDEREAVRIMLTGHGITDFELDMATNLPLYALLRNIDIHITHSSSVVIEAELFGVPSVIISQYGSEFFPEQIATGWALTAYKELDIIEAVKFQIAGRVRLQKHLYANKIYPDSAIVMREINEIIAQRI